MPTSNSALITSTQCFPLENCNVVWSLHGQFTSIHPRVTDKKQSVGHVHHLIAPDRSWERAARDPPQGLQLSHVRLGLAPEEAAVVVDRLDAQDVLGVGLEACDAEALLGTLRGVLGGGCWARGGLREWKGG